MGSVVMEPFGAPSPSSSTGDFLSLHDKAGRLFPSPRMKNIRRGEGVGVFQGAILQHQSIAVGVLE